MAEGVPTVEETSSNPSVGGAQPQSPGSNDGQKTLLELPDDKLAKRIRQMWTDQETVMRRYRAQWKVNRLRRMGITGVQLVKQQDTHQWVVWAPPGGTFTIPTLNKADRLCRRLSATMYADPAIPDATPARDDDRASDAAEFSTRALIVEGGEGGYEDELTSRQAFDLACTYDSGFRRWYVDPSGGGLAPRQIQASKNATTVQDALTLPNGAAQDPPYITRYVKPDGTLTDKVAEAELRWLPRLRCDVLSGKQVRMLPATARDIWVADGALVGALIPLGKLKQQFPDIMKKLSPEDLKKVVAERPEMYEDLLPVGIRPSDKVVAAADPKDDSLVFVLTCYYKANPQYSKGFYAIVAGDSVLLHKDVWYDEQNKRMLDVPIDQIKIYDDEDGPYGKGPMRLLGPGNEVRASQLGALLEHLDRFNNRKVFWPIASALQAKAMQAATGTYIPINPGGQPIFEDVPTFPDSSLKMLDFVTGEMDDEAGLQQTAQGIAQPSVKSGIHAQRIIEQALQGLSDTRQNVIRSRRRGWRIQLQLMRAFYTIPQTLRFKGDDGAYVVKQWTGADLGDTTDVDLEQGSASMLTPSAKAAVAEHLATIQAVGPDGRPMPILSALDLRRQAMTSVGGTVGLEDDPQTLRVKRQLSDWAEGPPQGWLDQRKKVLAQFAQQQQAAAAQAQQAGQQPQQAPPPQDPKLAAIFAPLPSDDEPYNAQLRHYEISRMMASTRFSRWPQEWQAGLLAEYQRARQSAGITTVAEQQQAQQQQASTAAAQAAAPKKSIQLKGELTPAETAQQVGVAPGPEAGAHDAAATAATEKSNLETTMIRKIAPALASAPMVLQPAATDESQADRSLAPSNGE